MTLTRRMVLELVGQAGGLGAAYMAMESLGLAVPTPADAENFKLPRGAGEGRTVAILGAGIAGLVAAYELTRAGYRVTVFEARDRIGGRSWTIRGGEHIVQTGRPTQKPTFSPGLYFNAGPARIPSTHRVILAYARKFGVALEPFVNSNRNASWDFAGKVYPERRRVEDMRGLIAELLAKAIDQKALDAEVPRDELAILRQFLVDYGSLDLKGNYRPSGSSGFAVEAGGYRRRPVPLQPLGFNELAPSSAIVTPYVFEHMVDMQPTMLQPVGGMDRIAHAIYDQVKSCVRLRTPVTAILISGDQVAIEHGPGDQLTRADHCVCTLPLPILSRISNNFSSLKKAAIAAHPPYLDSVKVAFEAPRFWQLDDNIFGGLAWTDRLNENVIYPSNDFSAKQGILVAAYCVGWTRRENPDAFSNMSHDDRFRVCRESIEALHPGKSRLLTKGATVAWHLTPYSEGAAAMWPGGPAALRPRDPSYAELLKPEGPVVFAGEHLSYQPAWQEGAALSAHEAVKLVAAMARNAAEKHSSVAQ